MAVATELQHMGRSWVTAASTLHLFFVQNVKSGFHFMHQFWRQNILPLLTEVGNLTGK